MISTRRQEYFESVDILRGFAAGSVIVYHVVELFGWAAFPSTGMLSWFRVGWMGVDLFFVISGCVIGLSAFSAIDRLGEERFRWPFFLRRLARIVPLHYLTLLVFVIFISPDLLFQNFWSDFGAHLLFLHNLDPIFHGAINGSNWSLGVEMQFYVLMLLLAPWMRNARWWLPFALALAVSWSWRYGVTRFVDPSAAQGGFHVFFATTQLPGLLDEFAAGLAVALLLRTDAGRKWVSGGGLSDSVLFALSVCAAAAFVYAYRRFAPSVSYPAIATPLRSLLDIAFGVVVLAACRLRVTGWARKLLAPLFYLGTISYGLYLWHLPVLLSLKRIAWLEPESVLPLAFVLTVTLAAISWHFFEEPFIRRVHREPRRAEVDGDKAAGSVTAVASSRGSTLTP